MTCTTARNVPGVPSDPYKPLRRVMRRDVHEYGTDIPWRELYESVRLEHLAAFLRCAPEGADAIIADAITDMVRGPGYERPRMVEKLVAAVTTPANGTCYAFMSVALGRLLNERLSAHWTSAQNQVAAREGEPDMHDPKEPHG